MSIFVQRYLIRTAKLARQRADNVKACSCSAQRWNAVASQLECLPGGLGRAKTQFWSDIARFKSGKATGADVWYGVKMLAAWGTAGLLGTVAGRKSIQGYKLYR
mmetsp:Transcript_19713/g.33866  ORF Transcript_19713/g.33866 Transcript_19713/m.33866 type:complete len:104 (+) Transcript_19713:46-357(+)